MEEVKYWGIKVTERKAEGGSQEVDPQTRFQELMWKGKSRRGEKKVAQGRGDSWWGIAEQSEHTTTVVRWNPETQDEGGTMESELSYPMAIPTLQSHWLGMLQGKFLPH